MSHKVYLIPGLGADSRMFKFQNDLGENHIPLDWIPHERSDTMASYAKRFSRLIDTSEPFSLLGVSMGGILAIELNKILKPEKVILVSSIKNKGERPMSSKIAKALSLYPLISGYAFKMIAYFTVTFFGLMQKDHSDLFKTMLRESDSSFMRWALIKVITWDSTETFDNVVHIHGDKDLVFPMKNFDNIIKVRGGNHFMIANRYAEVNAHIQEALG
ncbi:MAG: hypothetical protein COB85_06820 [Bacteroidetes bacterium]|nr:MAG: hypothetical protein COB85_06820 [Bacteroidota bacterium]